MLRGVSSDCVVFIAVVENSKFPSTLCRGASVTSERKQLREFLKDVRTLMREIVEEHHDLFRTDEETRQLFRAAWSEVNPLFDTAISALNSNDYDGELKRAGLTGNQLKLKLSGFRRAQDHFRLGGWKVGPLKKVLDWINTILGSLSAIPGVEPIKELKEAIENNLD
jgi:hypothetical protein